MERCLRDIKDLVDNYIDMGDILIYPFSRDILQALDYIHRHGYSCNIACPITL